jgi:hypothetical protein
MQRCRCNHRWRKDSRFLEGDRADATRLAVPAGERNDRSDAIDREFVAFLTHDLEGLVREQLGKHLVDLALRQRYIEEDLGLVTANMECRHTGARTIYIDGCDRLRTLYPRPERIASPLGEHGYGSQHEGQDDEENA